MSINLNLAKITEDWVGGYGQVGFYNNIFWDYDVVRTPGVPSMRLEPKKPGASSGSTNRQNNAREINSNWYSVVPGDRVLSKVWIKTDNGRPYKALAGARMALDFYAGSRLVVAAIDGVIGGSAGAGVTPIPDSIVVAEYVHWGTSEWTERVTDAIVPDQLYSFDQVKKTTFSPAAKIDSVVMWLQVWNSYGLGATEPGNAWFTDTELYINPVIVPPTPEPEPEPEPIVTQEAWDLLNLKVSNLEAKVLTLESYSFNLSLTPEEKLTLQKLTDIIKKIAT